MSDERGGSGRECLPEDQLPKLLNVVYNIWYAKWKPRSAAMTDDDWTIAIEEACRIMEQGDEYPFVRNLVMTFLYELEARAFGGYTDVTREKILMLLKEG